jgi:hypothetical protein
MTEQELDEEEYRDTAEQASLSRRKVSPSSSASSLLSSIRLDSPKEKSILMRGRMLSKTFVALQGRRCPHQVIFFKDLLYKCLPFSC